MTKKKPLLASVSERALMQRINRKLAHDDQRAGKSTERMQQSSQLGEYYIVNVRRNAIEGSFNDLEQYAREIGVLKPWERLDKEA